MARQAENLRRYHFYTLLLTILVAVPILASPLSEETRASVVQLNEVFMETAEQATPTVVSIMSQRLNSSGREISNVGSGVIVSSDGYILTNYHVIESADDISIKFNDNRVYQAEQVGADYTTDLAVLKLVDLEPSVHLPVIKFGDSDKCRIGEWVMAVGNPMELGISVTAGIISAKARRIDILSENPMNIEGQIDQSIESFIQTDAVINPGNSGGALINLNGELIGINTAIASNTGAYQGYGFAIPINLARRVMEDLIRLGRVVRPVLGVVIQTVTPITARALGLKSPQGVQIQDFSPRENSPAQIAGLRKGDVIVAIGEHPVTVSHELQEAIARMRPGEKVSLTIVRDGSRIVRTVTLGSKEILSSASIHNEQSSAARSMNLGMELRELEHKDVVELGLNSQDGVLVESVSDGSPVVKAGIFPGDVILEINHNPVKNVTELTRELDSMPVGAAALVMITRGGATHFVGLEIPE